MHFSSVARIQIEAPAAAGCTAAHGGHGRLAPRLAATAPQKPQRRRLQCCSLPASATTCQHARTHPWRNVHSSKRGGRCTRLPIWVGVARQGAAAQSADDVIEVYVEGQLVAGDPTGVTDAAAAATSDMQPAAAQQPHTSQAHSSGGSGSSGSGGGTKRCQQCSKTYPLRLFPPSKLTPDGRHVLCYGCRADANRQRRPRHRSEKLTGGHPPTTQPQDCATCGLHLPANFYCVTKRRHTGRHGICRACQSEYNRDRALSMCREVPSTKTCPSCGKEKAASLFFRQTGAKDGLQSSCRDCKRVTTRQLQRERLAPPPFVVAPLKRCSACGSDKAPQGFHRAPHTSDGRDSICIVCKNSGRRRRCQAARSSSSREGSSQTGVV